MRTSHVIFFVSAAALTGFMVRARPAALPQNLRLIDNIDYAGTGHQRQQLDLFLPKTKPAQPIPLVVYIHGGAWEGGSKDDASPLLPLIKEGQYAGASVGYRFSQDAIWPAQIHDCKAALRWLRDHAQEYGYDAEKIALYGISAGGHLVSLLGTSHGVAGLEGTVGTSETPAPRPTCVLNFCGPADFPSFKSPPSQISPDDPKSCVARLLGGPMKDKLEAAREASPQTYVSKDDPPFLHIHGTADNLVPYAQAVAFDAALGEANVPSALLTGRDGPHVFFSGGLMAKMTTFLGVSFFGEGERPADGDVPTK
jgi:acetyl esterase/lipase